MLTLITELMEQGIPLTKNGKDLHLTMASGAEALRWMAYNGHIKPVKMSLRTIRGCTRLRVLYYQEKA